MRQALLAAMSIVGLVAITIPASPALSRERIPAMAMPSGDMYCLQNRGTWGYPGNCQFSTYNQCMAAASGTAAYCGENPRYLFAERRQGYWPPR
jgi:hypothetical protein